MRKTIVATLSGLALLVGLSGCTGGVGDLSEASSLDEQFQAMNVAAQDSLHTSCSGPEYPVEEGFERVTCTLGGLWLGLAVFKDRADMVRYYSEQSKCDSSPLVAGNNWTIFTKGEIIRETLATKLKGQQTTLEKICAESK